MVRWCWVNFQCRGVLLIGIRVEQGPTAHAVGAGGHGFVVYHFFFFSLSLGDGPIYTEILSQRAVKPKTTNQPTNHLAFLNVVYIFNTKSITVYSLLFWFNGPLRQYFSLYRAASHREGGKK